MQLIKIGDIRIRFKGISQQQARSSLEGIENDILFLLGRQVSAGNCSKEGIFVAGDVDAGRVECRKGATDEEIRAAVAGRIARLIGSRIK